MAGVRAFRVGSRAVDYTGKIPAQINDCLLVDASAGAISVYLPLASLGFESIMVKKIDASANAVTVERSGTDTIDGATTYVLTARYQTVEVVPETGKWHVATKSFAGTGSVATDTLWDAAGDLAVGSGADAAGRLAKGSALQRLRVNAAATALEWADPLPVSGALATAATDALNLKVTGDSNDRFVVNADGKIEWGPGNAATDITLERSAARSMLLDNVNSPGFRLRNGAGEFWTELLKLESRGYGTSLVFNQGGYSQMQASAGLGIFGINGSTRLAFIGTAGVSAGTGNALATNATGPFMYVPQMPGTPTGTPSTTDMGTTVPIVIDTSGSKLWAYIGGTWKSVTLA